MEQPELPNRVRSSERVRRYTFIGGPVDGAEKEIQPMPFGSVYRIPIAAGFGSADKYQPMQTADYTVTKHNEMRFIGYSA